MASQFTHTFHLWAWARHHNILSWYVRPFFFIPFCFFAYRRSIPGLAVTLAALATSMFWFPAPETPDPRVIQFLAFEKTWLTRDWAPGKILLTLTVPATFIFLAIAFWKRSWWYGLGILTAVALGKVAWSVLYGGESGWAVLPPALIGLAVCNATVFLAMRWLAKRSSQWLAPER